MTAGWGAFGNVVVTGGHWGTSWGKKTIGGDNAGMFEVSGDKYKHSGMFWSVLGELRV